MARCFNLFPETLYRLVWQLGRSIQLCPITRCQGEATGSSDDLDAGLAPAGRSSSGRDSSWSGRSRCRNGCWGQRCSQHICNLLTVLRSHVIVSDWQFLGNSLRTHVLSECVFHDRYMYRNILIELKGMHETSPETKSPCVVIYDGSSRYMFLWAWYTSAVYKCFLYTYFSIWVGYMHIRRFSYKDQGSWFENSAFAACQAAAFCASASAMATSEAWKNMGYSNDAWEDVDISYI